MERRRFPPNDELYRSVCLAYDRVHEVNVRLHYLSCDPGSVGGRR